MIFDVGDASAQTPETVMSARAGGRLKRLRTALRSGPSLDQFGRQQQEQSLPASDEAAAAALAAFRDAAAGRTFWLETHLSLIHI